MNNVTRKLLVLVAVFFLSALLSHDVARSQNCADRDSLPIDVMQVFELPAHVTNPTLLRSENGYLLKGQISSTSDDQILAFTYQIAVLDGAGQLQMNASGTAVLKLASYATEDLSLRLPRKLKIKSGDRLVLAVEQVITHQLVWDVPNAKKALEAYGRGDYLAPEVNKVLNVIDSKPRPAVIY